MMLANYNKKAPKKATNLTVNQDLLKHARSLKLNLSQVLESRLIEILQEHERKAWLAQNNQAIEHYNSRIEKNGAFSDNIRQF